MNAHQRLLLDGYLPDNSTGKAALLGLLGWLRLELTEGWRTWFTPTAQPKPLFTPAPAAS